MCLRLSVQQLCNLQFENPLLEMMPHSTVCHDFAINRHTVARELPESPSHETDACLHEKNLAKHISNMTNDLLNTLGTKSPKNRTEK